MEIKKDSAPFQKTEEEQTEADSTGIIPQTEEKNFEVVDEKE